MIRFASLGSGSAGNALVVQSGGTCVLVDCGFTVQETVLRLARLGLEPSELDAILITHEHGDHIGSSGALARRYRIPTYMTTGTRLGARDPNYPEIREFQTGIRIAIGDLEIEPFTVPHDAREPSQFIFADGACRLALLTDAGHVSPHMVRIVSGVGALLLECNHDPALLATGPYPARLKRRVGGPYGHLSNADALRLLQQIDSRRLQHAVGMHLSGKNNTPELARQAMSAGLDCLPGEIALATQTEGFDWRELR
jgi:phosphoribosyl 1,2-cyclic phosphodiesterase